ncbi:hypothetical protein J1N35_017300 [Gossypium stocksii]|uniref:Uncharacterized protein n=1 Tax=Gossypium stocksii TaxID=47602 RepID=A0A9D3VNN7_9ROSI|nr:hypothetical protein J1N35_017300 [Gossypium stocksii]
MKSFSASKKDGSRKALWSLFYRDAERNPHKKETAGNGWPFEIDEVEAPNLGPSSNVVQGPVFESKEEGRTKSGIDHAERLLVEKPIGRQYRETQSEIMDYGFGRKSCDMDPRFSFDAGRISLDAATLSCQTLTIARSIDRRRKSLDRSSSIINTAAAVVVEMDEMKSVSNAKVSPAAVYYFKGPKLDVLDIDSNSNSLRAIVGQMDEMKLVSNAKVFPATVDYINGFKLGALEGDSNSNSLGDESLPGWLTQTRIIILNLLPGEERVLICPVLLVCGPKLSLRDESLPRGSARTRDYYFGSSRRRNSLDTSSFIRKTVTALVAEMDEMKLISNAKVSAATVDYINGAKLLVPDRDSNSNSSRDHRFENRERKGLSKKSWRWRKAWNIFWLIKRSVKKDEDGDRYSRTKDVSRGSYSESWPKLRGERNGDVRGGFDPKI